MRFIISILFYLSSFMYLTDSAIVPCNDCYRIITTQPDNDIINRYALQKNITNELTKIKYAVSSIEKILISHVHKNIPSQIKQTEEYRCKKLIEAIKNNN